MDLYAKSDYRSCADICSRDTDNLTPFELCIYVDCLYQIWDFSRIVDMMGDVKTRTTGTKFFARTDQILRRALMRVGRLTEAAAGLDQQDLASADISDLLLRAEVWDALGWMDMSASAYRRAVCMNPDDPMVRLQYGFHLLKAGRILDGLENWGVAERIFGNHPLRRHRPLWRGQPLRSKTLLIIFEHGLGDMIQFARFIIPLREKWPSARVVGRVPSVLQGLLALSFPGVEFVSDQDEEPAYDFYVPSVQLPMVLGARSLEPAAGYIRLGHRPAGPRGVHSDRFRLRVGICWRGYPRQCDQVRSMPLETFSTLFAAEDTEFVVLLNEVSEEEFLLLRSFENVSIPEITNFVELAEVISECDVILSVDTAVVHVAAAAGKPVLLLSRPDSCWRWGPSGVVSPWYPTVRILRHPVDLNWPVVLGLAAKQLEGWPCAETKPI
ncbi:MAG: hypothetical protein M3145_07000, partial [Pseudomonadota bacterium]|nr:hypothetical protein [Pseudomonadota bacterium]